MRAPPVTGPPPAGPPVMGPPATGAPVGSPQLGFGRGPAEPGALLPPLVLTAGLLLAGLLLRWLWARRAPPRPRPRALPGRSPRALPVGLWARPEPVDALLVELTADRRALLVGGPVVSGSWAVGSALHLPEPVALVDLLDALVELDAGGPPGPVLLCGPVLRLEGPMSPEALARALPGRAIVVCAPAAAGRAPSPR